MWRERRLKEIAESNQPAFASTSGMYWWLAEAPSKQEPSNSVSQLPAMAISERKQDASLLAMGSTRSVAVSAEETTGADPIREDFKQAVRIGTADKYEERLSWDVKSCSFVACM
jgi:hypothetical protein